MEGAGAILYGKTDQDRVCILPIGKDDRTSSIRINEIASINDGRIESDGVSVKDEIAGYHYAFAQEINIFIINSTSNQYGIST